MSKARFIEWDSQYSVGASVIDKQHKKLIKLLNDTINHSNGNKIDERKYFNKIKKKAEKILKKHFETEEKILAKTEYEKLEEHIAEHNKFYEEIKKSNEEIENNIKEINLFNSTAFVKEWLLNHIKNFDKKADKYIMEWANKKTLKTQL
jgi:hemerythrin-like metal-binding protein